MQLITVLSNGEASEGVEALQGCVITVLPYGETWSEAVEAFLSKAATSLTHVSISHVVGVVIHPNTTPPPPPSYLVLESSHSD